MEPLSQAGVCFRGEHLILPETRSVNDIVLEFQNVYKRFSRAEKNDSLRDLIPHLTKRLLFQAEAYKLKEKEFWAVKDVSFAIGRGEAVGIIGPNGAGKSTILKLLSGILRPNSGRIAVNGRISALIEVGAGFHPDLTGRENIYLNGAILGMKRSEIQRKMEQIVEFSELGDFVDMPVKRYSSGMYARLGFSVAAHVDPEILLVDEVLSVGDFTFQHKCLERMRDIVKRGTTVIFISHNIPSVITLCPRTILLNKGEVHLYGDSREVCRRYYNVYSQSRKVTDGNLITLKSIRMTNRSNEETSIFRSGEWGRVEITVEGNGGIENLIMGFLVKQSDGSMAFDANSDKIANKYYSFRAGEAKTIVIDFRNNLPEGTYFLGIHFLEPNKGFYFYDSELIEFYVNSPKTLGGAYLDLKW